MELAILLIAGAASGLIAGLVGLAGGVVIVPVITWLYGAAALHDAIVISWFAVLFNSFGAAAKQYKLRTPDERQQMVSTSGTFVVGVALATGAVAVMFGRETKLITPTLVAVLQLCLAAVMLFPISNATVERRSSNRVVDFTLGGVIGGVSTLIGVGGGTYTIAYYVYAVKTKFQDAIAAANLTGLTIGVLSVVAYLISVAVSSSTPSDHTSPISTWGKVLLIGAGVVASSVGVRFSRKLPTKRLKQILVIVLAISAGRLLWAA
jgi:uncharacterized membrane protein YfcA